MEERKICGEIHAHGRLGFYTSRNAVSTVAKLAHHDLAPCYSWADTPPRLAMRKACPTPVAERQDGSATRKSAHESPSSIGVQEVEHGMVIDSLGAATTTSKCSSGARYAAMLWGMTNGA